MSKQRLLVFVLAAALFVLTQGPTIVALATAPAGALPPAAGEFGSRDQLTYFAFIEQARQHAGVFLENRFTPEPTAPLLLPYWGMLGLASHWLNVSMIAAYVGAIGLLGLALLLAIRAFADRVLGKGSGVVGVVLVALAGGLGWVGALAWAVNQEAGHALQKFFPDWFHAPLSLTGEMSLSSHFFAGHLLLVAVLGLLLCRPRWATAAGAFVAAAALGLLHPYSLGLVVGVCFAVPLLGTFIRRKVSYYDYMVPAAAVLGAATAGLYYWQSLEHDAGLASWYSQNILPSPHPLGLLLAYVPMLPLVAIGVRALWQRRAELASRLLLAWLLLPLAMAYLPVLYQRRFLDGYYIPVGLVAAFGWQHWNPRRRAAKTLAATVLAALLLVTPLLRAGLQAETVATWSQQPIALTSGEAAALRWVGERCQRGEVAVADRVFVRLWLPYIAPACRTDAAHQHLSVSFMEHYDALGTIFSSTTPPAEAAATWRRFFNNASYLVVSDPSWAPSLPLAPAAQFGPVRVFAAE